jgi:hypothetical protein
LVTILITDIPEKFNFAQGNFVRPANTACLSWARFVRSPVKAISAPLFFAANTSKCSYPFLIVLPKEWN